MKFELAIVSLGVAAGLMLGCISKAQAQTEPPLIPERNVLAPTAFGIHTFSIHSKKLDENGLAWNNNNPGVYARWDRWVAGTYYNSIRRQSVYAGYAYPLHENLDIVVGVVTGYDGVGYTSSAVMPMVIPSAHFKLTEHLSVRLNLALGVKKGSATAVNLALEWKL